MATKLTGALSREITIDQGVLRGEWIITATGYGITVRQKGRRAPWGPVSWGAVVFQAAKLEAAGKPIRRRATRNLLPVR